jgi:hypothetical protein
MQQTDTVVYLAVARRGLTLAVGHAVARSALGTVAAYWTPQTGNARWLAMAVMIVMAFAWGYLDGKRDRRPSWALSGRDWSLFWLGAAALAGVSGGLLGWLAGLLPGVYLDENGLLFELTIGAAWVLLLVYIPALAGVAAGRALADRRSARTTETV